MENRVALLILDGWGIGSKPEVDAIASAETPVIDNLMRKHPSSQLVTYGMEVGLPKGQMGNSEVGHLNIGAGRVVYQQFAKINLAVSSGELAKNTTLVSAMEQAAKDGRAIHMMGLLSDGGVHSHINHLKCLIDVAETIGSKQTYVHAFLDGRDTAPKGGLGYLRDLNSHIAGKHTRIASLIGRYYAMDRDLRWERIKLAYDLLVHGTGEVTSNLELALEESYARETTDEFIAPIVNDNGNGQALATIKDGDLLICFNFRTDRPRQISRALTQEDFPEYEMKKLDLHYLTMTKYDDQFKNIEVLFGQEDLQKTLGEVVAEAGMTQVRMAETEKYPHVTFFFNGGREEAFVGEKRILVPSPKVATYDLKPEMSAPELTQALLDHLQKETPNFICLNFANTDMVGHTGDFSAAIKAAEVVDGCVGQLMPRLVALNYSVLIIADHGNADFMVNDDGTPNTAHTKNLVPCIFIDDGRENVSIRDGKLGDLAPTILTLLEIPVPSEMTGQPLIS